MRVSALMSASDDWRSFNRSLWRAKEILDGMTSLLEGYHYNNKAFPPRVRTPEGGLYECLDMTGSDVAE